jgi:hypothetical protein
MHPISIHISHIYASHPRVQAARAYDAAAVAIRGCNARTNFQYPFDLTTVVHTKKVMWSAFSLRKLVVDAATIAQWQPTSIKFANSMGNMLCFMQQRVKHGRTTASAPSSSDSDDEPARRKQHKKQQQQQQQAQTTLLLSADCPATASPTAHLTHEDLQIMQVHAIHIHA